MKELEPVKLIELDTDSMEIVTDKHIQPYITNDLLDRLLNSQTPKWISIISFILLVLSTSIAIWALLHSYGRI